MATKFFLLVGSAGAVVAAAVVLSRRRRTQKALQSAEDAAAPTTQPTENHQKAEEAEVDKLRDVITAAAERLRRKQTLSPNDIRGFHSRVRCAYLELEAVDEKEARFPISPASELAVQRAIAAAAAASSSVPPLQQLGRCARLVLDAAAQGTTTTAVELAVIVHQAAQRSAVDEAGSTVSAAGVGDAPHVSPQMVVRELGTERGYYAASAIGAGTVLLDEQAHVFSSETADMSGLLAALVLGRGLLDPATGLRAAPGADASSSAAAQKAAEWLARVEGVAADDAKQAFLAGENNGWNTTLAGTEEEMQLLSEKVALFNHSCWPNCTLRRDATTARILVYALAPVEPGTELTICYDETLALCPVRERRAFLSVRFGFDCTCCRCKGVRDPHAAGGALLASEADSLLIEMALKDDGNDGDESIARRAHASIFKLERRNGKMAGFRPIQHDAWAEAKRAAASALTVLRKECESTHWMVVMARALYCTTLEALADNDEDRGTESAQSAALRALAEHAAALIQLYPPHADPLMQLAKRVEALRARLPAEAAARVTKAHAKALDGLQQQSRAVEAWLSKGQ